MIQPHKRLGNVFIAMLLVALSPLVAADWDKHDTHHDKQDKATYLLSLGTSLAVGVQPDENGDNQRTDEGYPDQLFEILSMQHNDLRLVKLGCPGETTKTMIKGGIPGCAYEQGSQLAEAVAFLRKHRDDVALITIDIGVNDILFSGCIIETAGVVTGIDVDCLLASDGPFAEVSTKLPKILRALRRAADDDTPIVAMNYYNPFLALWLSGLDGQEPAMQSQLLVNLFNDDVLEQTYARFGVPVADVAGVYESNTFLEVPLPPPDGPLVPQNVALICLWTYMCAPAPIGPNVHANPDGYGAIASAFALALPSEDDDDEHEHGRHRWCEYDSCDSDRPRRHRGRCRVFCGDEQHTHAEND